MNPILGMSLGISDSCQILVELALCGSGKNEKLVNGFRVVNVQICDDLTVEVWGRGRWKVGFRQASTLI